ncbi:MAG: pectate lyase [Colwellia sp.]|nr:pectate lyase [Colwellia sp.]
MSTIKQPEKQLAFPSAEGFGAHAKGGRGGDVYHVTNLKNDGKGSLRYGLEKQQGPRTIVFDVSGNIMINKKLAIRKANLTIAGQTAPDPGVTVGGYPFQVGADDVIVRYLRFRLGDINKQQKDAVSINSGNNIIIDHVSASWSIDETFSSQGNKLDNLTIQWSMITESLKNSYHKKGAHGYGGILGGLRQSVHHNLYAHHSSRNPKVTGRRHTETDFRNNVIYNWGFNSNYDGTKSHINWVNNYYKPGPGTEDKVNQRIFRLSNGEISSGNKNFEWSNTFTTSLYAEGNYMEGSVKVTNDNWDGGIDFDNGASEILHRAKQPFAFPVITEQTAINAYPLVLAKAGASLFRDSVDSRIINEVKSATTTFGDNGFIDSQDDVGGYPQLAENKRSANFDTDQDGMPDAWEVINNLDPKNDSDRNGDSDADGYTNLEEYLNSITKTELAEVN